ncbi:hypothetical protein J4E81_010249 [Alternaria sp. BMP 2799]|nr:hypothetical protein J4E81_010249 [Alternaria sp. BMP 2799]
MSFGFSIGDIILLSQLTYDLYSSLSSGRQAATRDLKELEEVLFSLKCALDHLKEASSDVLTRPGFQHGGSGLKEKLDVMIGSCASTLQELDKVTKKHRDVEMHANKGKTKLRTLDDVKKSIHVNWQRVRWDREKLSLQQYREKLKGLIRHVELPAATVALNNKRRAFGAREYEAFKQRYAKPENLSKPSFLTSVTPSSQDLQACIPHIFQSTAEGKQQTQELKNEVTRWTHEFSHFVIDRTATHKSRDESVLTLLGVLNEAIDSSSEKIRKLFYETSDSAGFTSVLNQVERTSKSVRVMKEIEEFQDAKEECSERTVR